jgi:ComF family protein
MREWLDGLLAVLLAPTCGACGQALTRPTQGCICQACWHALPAIAPPVCDRCGGPLPNDRSPLASPVCPQCVGLRTWVDRTRAAGDYSGSLRGIIHALKYDGRRTVARMLGARMREAGLDLIADANVCVPVPLHHARRRSRGFNQAEDLARHLGVPVVHGLRRIRATETQALLPANGRLANVDGAFRATRRGTRLRGASVLLVDDVRTTGATLDACAHALKQAGAREVYALTAARVAVPGT